MRLGQTAWRAELPRNWATTQLKRIAQIRYGLSQPPREDASGVPFIRATDVSRGRINTETVKYVDPADVPNRRDTRLSAGDIIVVRSGAYTGDSAIVPVGLADSVIGYDMVVSPRQTLVEPAYVAWCLLSAEALDSQIYLCRARAAQPHLNAEELGATVLPLPPLPSQNSIATFLDRKTAQIDALIEKKQRLIELLQEKRTALITRAVTRGLDPNVEMKDSGVEWLGEIPLGWGLSRLKFVSSFVTSGSRGWAQYYSDEGPTFIRIGNLRSASIDLDLENRQRVQPPAGSETRRAEARTGDLLVSITALIGGIGVVPEDFGEAYISQHIALVRLRRRAANPRWLAYCLLSKIGQAQFKRELYGGTKDGLGLDDVREALVVVPHADTQDLIVDFLDRHLAALEALTERIEKAKQALSEYRTALISAAVTGKIDVREAA